MSTTVSIAAAQTVPVPGDVSANTAHHQRLIAEAGRCAVDTIVFPELSLTGYELDMAPRLAFTPKDARLAPLQDEVRRHGVRAIVGAPIRIAGRLHIGAFIIGADGDMGVYTKRHLGAFSDAARVDGCGDHRFPPPERAVFQPGGHDPTIELSPGVVAAAAICADVGQDEHPATAARRGARVYLASMFVIPSAYTDECARLRLLASRYRMCVLMSNYGGPSGGLAAAGRAAAWSADGTRLGVLPPDGEGLAIMRMNDGHAVSFAQSHFPVS